MNISIFDEGYYSRLDIDEKCNILQHIENYFAKLQNRPARTVIITSDQKLVNKNAKAQYNFEFNDNIHVNSSCSKIESLFQSVVHEGIHAMYNDAFNGVVDNVCTFSKINIKEVTNERINKNIIYNHFSIKQNIDVFNLCYAEEVIAHHDTKCFALKWYFDQCNTKGLRKKYFYFYENIIAEEVNKINS